MYLDEISYMNLYDSVLMKLKAISNFNDFHVFISSFFIDGYFYIRLML